MTEPGSQTGSKRNTAPLRIANASGYWGDDLTALKRQIEGGPVDVVTMDFLAEITMSILQKQVQRNPATGFAVDFVDQLDDVMAEAIDNDITIISNAGGVRPLACGEAIVARAGAKGLDPRVGVVAGDDLMDRIAAWHGDGVDMSNMDDGRPFAEIVDHVSSANAYFGAAPVVRALEEGAKFIVTGRVTDTGITLAPMIHHFGWATDDWDRMAAGIIAGHILECGAQSTGGNFTDWRDVPSFHNVGYPIVEVEEDGSFVVTKHAGTGGLINVATVREQLVYEMGDPSAYLTPDVVVDFGSIQLEDDGPDRVRVSGIRGAAPTDLLKVSLSYSDGYKASGGVIVCGPDAKGKADMFGEILWGRLPQYEDTLTEAVGASATWGPLSPSQESNEVMARFGVRDHDKGKVREFSKMLPAMVLSGPPGVGVIGGRPPVQDVVAYWPCLIPRHLCVGDVVVMGGGDRVEATVPFEGPTGPGRVEPSGSAGAASVDTAADPAAGPELSGELVTVKLAALAHGRSGDKGDTCNIGVIARHPALYPWLVETITAKRVKEAFDGIAFGEVERFEVANIDALNFLLHECLGGGGTLSLHIDAQGKTYSHALLSIDVEIDRALAALVDAV
ncbi:MAG: acyclic terpene utilization AtuA family protein [Acidimicrobiales bacterium]